MRPPKAPDEKRGVKFLNKFFKAPSYCIKVTFISIKILAFSVVLKISGMSVQHFQCHDMAFFIIDDDIVRITDVAFNKTYI